MIKGKGVFDNKTGLLIVVAVLALAVIVIFDSFQREPFVDEGSFLQNVANFVKTKSIIPSYTRYPTFYSYLIFIPVSLTFLIFYGAKGLPVEGLSDLAFLKFIFHENFNVWIKAARIVTLLFSLAILFLVLKRIAKKCGFPAVLITALVFILDPFGIYLTLSGYGLPDIPMTFMATLALLLCFDYVENKNSRYLYWASFISGLAMSTKLNAIMMIFPLFTVPLLINKRKAKSSKHYGRIVCLVILGFLLGSPACLFAFGTYWEGFSQEADILFKSGAFGNCGLNWAWVGKVLWALNPVFTLLILITIAYIAFRHTQKDILFLSLLIPSFLILGFIQKKLIWYFIFLYPLLVYYWGQLFGGIFKKISRKRLGKPVMYGIMIAIFILPAQNMYRRLSVSILPDNRSAAREWIYENIPAGTAIAVGTYHVPKLHDVEKLNQRIEVTLSCSRFIEEIKNYYSRFPVYQITKLGVDSDYNFDNLLEADVKYVLIADWNYMKMFPRDPSFIPQKGQPQYGQFIKRRNFYRKLLSEDSPFKLKKKFSSGSGPKIELLRLR